MYKSAKELHNLLNRLDEEKANYEKASNEEAKRKVGKRMLKIQRLLGVLA